MQLLAEINLHEITLDACSARDATRKHAKMSFCAHCTRHEANVACSPFIFFSFSLVSFFFCSTSTRYSVNRIHAKLFSSARQSHTPSRIIQLQRSAMDRLELEREREIGGRRRRRVSSCHLYSASIASFLMHYLLHFQLKYLEKAHIRDLHYVRSVFFFFDGLLLRTLICVYLLIPWN